MTLRARWVTLRGTLGDAKSSLGDAKSSLGDVHALTDGRWVAAACTGTVKFMWAQKGSDEDVSATPPSHSANGVTAAPLQGSPVGPGDRGDVPRHRASTTAVDVGLGGGGRLAGILGMNGHGSATVGAENQI